jgi:hypothetical protein
MAEYSPIVPNTIEYNLGSIWETDCNRVNIEKIRHSISLIYSLMCYFIFRLTGGLLWQEIFTGFLRDLVTKGTTRSFIIWIKNNQLTGQNQRHFIKHVLSSRWLTHFFNPIQNTNLITGSKWSTVPAFKHYDLNSTMTHGDKNLQFTPWSESARETIPTERPPFVGEVSANFCG